MVRVVEYTPELVEDYKSDVDEAGFWGESREGCRSELWVETEEKVVGGGEVVLRME